MFETLKTPFMGLTKRVLKQDFSGNTRIALKNSIYNFSRTAVAKVGSVIFTIILARLLLPETFGLYSLALSTIMIFAAFSNLGVGQTVVKFLSSCKSEQKSKDYFAYLFKVKMVLTIFSIVFLVLLAYPLAYSYYDKPIFLALLAGSFYIFFSGLASIFESVFQSSNNFRKGLFMETILQISRIFFVPIVILLLIDNFSTETLLFYIYLALSISFLFSFVYVRYGMKKQVAFFNLKSRKLKKSEKRNLNLFIIALASIAVSKALFGYIDMFILGRFVDAEFIGFYRAAFILVGSAAPLITFSSALFPIFSRIKGKQLARGMKKAVFVTNLVSIPALILTFFIAPFIVRFIFGTEYLDSVNILRLFAVLLFIAPLIGIYSSYLISQNKPKKVAQSMFIATILNVILNYVLIVNLLQYGQLQAVYGAAIATIISKLFYLLLLVFRR